jgi:ATP phosphoribosyltransferase involved in histidine biosynthesis
MRSGLSAQGQKLAEQAAARKDLPRLEEVLAHERISKKAARTIREAPELYGQEEVLARGRVLAAGDPALAAPLERLAQVYHLLCAAGHRDSLLLDLGEFRGFDYYDGVVFDVFAEGMGAGVGGGGRYDHLIGRFGRPLPSTGFGLDIDRLFRTVEFPEEGSVSGRVDYLVVAPRRATRLLMAVAAQLRRTRSRVVQQTVKGSDAALVSTAVTAGLAQQAAAVVVVGAPGMGHDDVLVLDRFAARAWSPIRYSEPSFEEDGACGPSGLGSSVSAAGKGTVMKSMSAVDLSQPKLPPQNVEASNRFSAQSPRQ